MDAKNAEALIDPGARTILTHLVNVPSRVYVQMEWSAEGPDPETESRATEFIEKYGPLREFQNPAHNLLYIAFIGRALRHAWAVREVESETKWVNVTLSQIVDYKQLWGFSVERPIKVIAKEAGWGFSANSGAFRGRTKKPLERPMLTPDFSSGEWTLKPRDLADALAKELMHSRNMLQICEKTDCGRFFIKEFSRDRYCSNPCSDEMRRVGQREWVRNHRAKASAKQKTRKKRK